MSQPYIGEIRMVGFNFAPAGWMFCQGQLLPIAEYEALFQLIGTTYGGDGQTTFGLPDLRSRIPVHQGSGFVVGQQGGSETVTLTTAQLPAHTHPVSANNGTSGTPASSPSGAFWNKWTGAAFSSAATNNTMNPAAVSSVGGGQPHLNIPPYQVTNFIISLFGIFPTQN